MEALRLDNVTYEYKTYEGNKIVAVNGVSLVVEEGQFVALVGHNGSGKSTLAKLLNGLLRPKKGTVYVYGTDTKDKEKIFDVRSKVGMVFQNPDNQMIASIVEDDVAFGPENLGVPREEIIERVETSLRQVGMYEYRKSTPFKMSGGQKQRIAIAGVLAIRPKIMVLDESTAMLDPRGRREVMAVAHSLNKEYGMTVIHITHYMEEALEADRVLVMNDGSIVADGTPSEVFAQREVIEKSSLALPLISRLAQRLRESGLPLSDGILTEDELTEELCRLL